MMTIATIYLLGLVFLVALVYSARPTMGGRW
jgi:hypothetical protein